MGMVFLIVGRARVRFQPLSDASNGERTLLRGTLLSCGVIVALIAIAGVKVGSKRDGAVDPAGVPVGASAVSVRVATIVKTAPSASSASSAAATRLGVATAAV